MCNSPTWQVASVTNSVWEARLRHLQACIQQEFRIVPLEVLDELQGAIDVETSFPAMTPSMLAELHQLRTVAIGAARARCLGLMENVSLELAGVAGTLSHSTIRSAASALEALADTIGHCWRHIGALRRSHLSIKYWTETQDHPVVASGIFWVQSAEWTRWENRSTMASLGWARRAWHHAALLREWVSLRETNQSNEFGAMLWDNRLAGGPASERYVFRSYLREPVRSGSRAFWLKAFEAIEVAADAQISEMRVTIEKLEYPYNESIRFARRDAALLVQIPRRHFVLRALLTPP
jgi:hypothetical protein